MIESVQIEAIMLGVYQVGSGVFGWWPMEYVLYSIILYLVHKVQDYSKYTIEVQVLPKPVFRPGNIERELCRQW